MWPALGEVPAVALAEPETGEPDARGRSPAFGAVVGRIRDFDGNPVVGARVVLSLEGYEATTSADGEFHFYRVPTGNVLLRAEATGYRSFVRTVRVEPEMIHQVNLRIGTDASPPPAIVVHRIDGVLSCRAVAVGVGVLCEGPNDHELDLPPRTEAAIVEIVWPAEVAAALNLTAGPPDASDPLTGRPASGWASAEGGSVLRLEFVPPGDATAASLGVRHASTAASVPADVPYTIYATFFLNREPPENYSAAPQQNRS